MGNLPYSLTENEVEAAFRRFGEISEVALRRDYSGNSRGFGFVEYEKQESAEKALSSTSPLVLNGRRIYIKHTLKMIARITRVFTFLSRAWLKNGFHGL